MKNMKYFDFDGFEEFKLAFWQTGAFDIGYHSEVFDRDMWFTLTVDGCGYNIYPPDEFEETHSACYETAEEMIEKYIFPDGCPMKEIFEFFPSAVN